MVTHPPWCSAITCLTILSWYCCSVRVTMRTAHLWRREWHRISYACATLSSARQWHCTSRKRLCVSLASLLSATSTTTVVALAAATNPHHVNHWNAASYVVYQPWRREPQDRLLYDHCTNNSRARWCQRVYKEWRVTHTSIARYTCVIT